DGAGGRSLRESSRRRARNARLAAASRPGPPEPAHPSRRSGEDRRPAPERLPIPAAPPPRERDRAEGRGQETREPRAERRKQAIEDPEAIALLRRRPRSAPLLPRAGKACGRRRRAQTALPRTRARW